MDLKIKQYINVEEIVLVAIDIIALRFQPKFNITD